MFDSVATIGKQLIEEKRRQKMSEKEAVVSLLVESIEGIRKRKAKGEQLMKRIVINPAAGKAYLDREWARELQQSTLEEYRYIFEYMHPKRKRPRLTFKELMETSNMIKQVVSRIEKLRSNNRCSNEMQVLYNYLKGFKGSDLRDEEGAALYTVAVEESGNIRELAKEPGYLDLLYSDIRMEHEIVDGTCHLCGKRSSGVICDPDFPSGELLKVYITDQPGFLSGIPFGKQKDSALMKSFTICPDCISALLVGYKFLKNTKWLSSRIERTDVVFFIIPRSTVPIGDIRKWLDYLKLRWSALSSLEAARVLDKKIREDYEYEEKFIQNYYITLALGARMQASFRLYGVIREAPFTRLALYTENARKVHEFLEDNTNANLRDFLHITNIGYFLPIKVRKGEAVDLEPVMNVFHAILRGTPISLALISRYAMTVAKIKYYGAETGYSVEPPISNAKVTELCKSILAYKMLVAILMRMNEQNKGQIPTLQVSVQDMPEHILKCVEDYKDWQRALFFLGYVIGEVGAHQMSSRKERHEFPPILKKIQFDGMRGEKLMRLSLDVAEAMKNYEVVDKEIQKVWANCQIILDKSLNEMKDPVENVFHILTGYAYATLRRLTGKAREGVEDE
jgi:CRISPR-associated Csh1 family protein